MSNAQVETKVEADAQIQTQDQEPKRRQTNKELRDCLFDGPSSKPRTKIVEVDGKRFECRAPTMRTVQKWSMVEGNPSISDIVIGQVFNPDTGQPLFDEASREILESLPATSPVAYMAEVVASLAEGDVEIDSGNE